nr:uncharacterized protein LOC116776487 [Danaus plexippus plexippus]
MALYGAPIWVDSLESRSLALLRRPQQILALKVARAYRTLSYNGACVLAGVPPWNLEAEAIAAVYRRRSSSRNSNVCEPSPQTIAQWRRAAHADVLDEWEMRFLEPRVNPLISAVRPVLKEDEEDTAQHTRQVCPAWNEFRAGLLQIVGSDLSLPALIASMVGNEENWQAVLVFAEKIMLAKEAVEREREQNRNSLPIRRIRVGRRRRPYMATSVAS